jgi:hypothetical protein
MSFFTDPNFEHGAPGWRPLNKAQAVTFGQTTDASIARTNSTFAYARTTEEGGSVALDFDWPQVEMLVTDPSNGDISRGAWSPASITIMAWVRTRPGAADFSGQVTLWDLTGFTANSVQFIATQQWQIITIMGMRTPNTKFRIELYLNTTNEDLLIDCLNCL